MEQEKYLIDTNALIDYLGNMLPTAGMSFMHTVIDAIPNVSVITKIELLGFNSAESYHQILSELMEDAVVLHMSNKVVDRCIELRKKKKVKLPDAIIAATALVHNLTIITRNTSDFNSIEGLRLINPHKI